MTVGYTTDFTGQFDLDKQLTLDDFRLLEDLSGTDGRDEDECPDAYCQWEPTKDGRGIRWDGGEKFYLYPEWLQWIIDQVLTPKGYVLTGQVAFRGEDTGDRGTLVIEDGKVVSRKYMPENDDLKALVRKGLADADDDGSAYWYLEQIGKKLGL